MNREDKKRQLRSNIVPMPRPGQRGLDGRDARDEQEPRRHRAGLPRFLIPAAALVFAAALGFCFYQYQKEYQFTEYDVVWEKSMRYTDERQGGEETEDPAGQETQGGGAGVAGSSFVNFVPYGDNMIKYTKDGASYIDASGKTIWSPGYEMKTPIICVNGDYAAIADQQGNDIYIFGPEGCVGQAKTQLPITKVAVSAKGVAAAVVEDSKAAYILYYRKDGSPLKVNIKMLLSGDGYPIDIALSPDGKQIVLSVMYLKNGTISNKVVFYDFSEIGKNVENRLVGGFEEEFEGKMAARVRYLNQDTVCAVSDKGLTFISVKNVIPDTNVVSVPIEDTMRSVCYSDRYVGVVVDNPSGYPYRLDIYKTDGSKAGFAEFDFPYSGLQIDGGSVILYNDEACRVYNLSGKEKFECRFDFPVSMARVGKNHMNSLIVAGSEVMVEIKLK